MTKKSNQFLQDKKEHIIQQEKLAAQLYQINDTLYGNYKEQNLLLNQKNEQMKAFSSQLHEFESQINQLSKTLGLQEFDAILEQVLLEHNGTDIAREIQNCQAAIQVKRENGSPEATSPGQDGLENHEQVQHELEQQERSYNQRKKIADQFKMKIQESSNQKEMQPTGDQALEGEQLQEMVLQYVSALKVEESLSDVVEKLKQSICRYFEVIKQEELLSKSCRPRIGARRATTHWRTPRINALAHAAPAPTLSLSYAPSREAWHFA